MRNAIRTTDFRDGQVRPELRRGRRYMVFYAGLIGPDDGLEQLVLAARHVVAECRRSDVHFVVMGDGDCLAAIKQMTARLGLEDAIEFTGWCQDDRLMADYLATADLCVAPDPKSPVADLCSMNKIVEYMAMGKAVVAFDLNEAQETARGAGAYVASNGYSDPAAMAEEILELLNSPQRRELMGRIGQQRFNEVLAWEHQRENLLRAYDTLLGRPAAPDLLQSTA